MKKKMFFIVTIIFIVISLCALMVGCAGNNDNKNDGNVAGNPKEFFEKYSESNRKQCTSVDEKTDGFNLNVVYKLYDNIFYQDIAKDNYKDYVEYVGSDLFNKYYYIENNWHAAANISKDNVLLPYCDNLSSNFNFITIGNLLTKLDLDYSKDVYEKDGWKYFNTPIQYDVYTPAAYNTRVKQNINSYKINKNELILTFDYFISSQIEELNVTGKCTSTYKLDCEPIIIPQEAKDALNGGGESPIFDNPNEFLQSYFDSNNKEFRWYNGDSEWSKLVINNNIMAYDDVPEEYQIYEFFNNDKINYYRYLYNENVWNAKTDSCLELFSIDSWDKVFDNQLEEFGVIKSLINVEFEKDGDWFVYENNNSIYKFKIVSRNKMSVQTEIKSGGAWAYTTGELILGSSAIEIPQEAKDALNSSGEVPPLGDKRPLEFLKQYEKATNKQILFNVKMGEDNQNSQKSVVKLSGDIAYCSKYDIENNIIENYYMEYKNGFGVKYTYDNNAWQVTSHIKQFNNMSIGGLYDDNIPKEIRKLIKLGYSNINNETYSQLSIFESNEIDWVNGVVEENGWYKIIIDTSSMLDIDICIMYKVEKNELALKMDMGDMKYEYIIALNTESVSMPQAARNAYSASGLESCEPLLFFFSWLDLNNKSAYTGYGDGIEELHYTSDGSRYTVNHIFRENGNFQRDIIERQTHIVNEANFYRGVQLAGESKIDWSYSKHVTRDELWNDYRWDLDVNSWKQFNDLIDYTRHIINKDFQKRADGWFVGKEENSQRIAVKFVGNAMLFKFDINDDSREFDAKFVYGYECGDIPQDALDAFDNRYMNSGDKPLQFIYKFLKEDNKTLAVISEGETAEYKINGNIMKYETSDNYIGIAEIDGTKFYNYSYFDGVWDVDVSPIDNTSYLKEVFNLQITEMLLHDYYYTMAENGLVKEGDWYIFENEEFKFQFKILSDSQIIVKATSLQETFVMDVECTLTLGCEEIIIPQEAKDALKN